ncbi:hypothetical protein [Paenibacillus alginolyticus]|uniref:Uncharacterized protein n=1 Tax=Paenibacillus alginolyticus TaxID=59839 RepID=A0ABT4GBK5_9BACL|nr:hypothetical protein [Paenibacillus alginolyticus]MCY9693575.1 hypothetical protein [Paenibacillus alginolyticus]MEC0146674.1 hypothetical protein [Paenibacillus alginolyticus]
MYSWQAGKLTIVLNEKGQITSMNDAVSGKSYASAAHAAPLIRVLIDGRLEAPLSADYEVESDVLTLQFKESGVKVGVAIKVKELYMTFTVTCIDGADVDAIIWGPYVTTIAGSIGEAVGVVHDGQFAIGIQALNVKTIGGWPMEVEKLQFAYQSFEDAKFEYESCAAWPSSEGSLLQLFTRNRTKAARRPVWNLPDIEVAAIGEIEAEIVGSSIAMFGCGANRVLDTIEAVELGEDLPHPMIEGVWGKTSPAANQSYLITDFSESTMAVAVQYTRKAGLRYVYHPDPFGQWGHFSLKPHSFPNGDDGLKSCVDLAEGMGVHVGIHTLSNFTTLNDPYVTPVPDERLQAVGVARLVEPVIADDVNIVVDDPHPFATNLFRRSARVGSELIEYDAISGSAPWKLLGVRRGVNSTAAYAHEAGAEISRLWDHGYDVFFPNIELQDEYSQRIAELFSKTGLKQISFDGLEGCYASGHDGYGVNRFVKMCYDGWGDDVINDASIVVPNYLWHIFTRFNWGEPWGAATREGQLEWRLSNQRFFARNFIPPMLGWFLVRSATDQFEATVLDEIEWVLSKAAGFNAGFALVADMGVLQRNGNINVLFESVRQWEMARQAGAFTEEQRERLRDPKGDWHLRSMGEGRWNLYPVNISKPLVCNPAELQPGQPGGADWTFYNRYADQPLKFILRVMPSYGNDDASVKRPAFFANGVYMTFETEILANQYLVCDGDRIGKIYDQNWNLQKTVETSMDAPIVRNGGQTLAFSCKFEGEMKPSVSVKVFTWGEPETVEDSSK